MLNVASAEVPKHCWICCVCVSVGFAEHYFLLPRLLGRSTEIPGISERTVLCLWVQFFVHAEYPKLIEREVSLEGRFVKLKPENVEVHWVHNPWNVRSFEMLELRQLEHNRVYSMWEFSS